MPNGKWVFMITSLYSVRLKNLWIDRIALKTITSNSRKLSWRERKVITTSLACVAAYGVPFPPKFNVPFYIVLCTICPTFCVCHLSLNSRFNFLHSTFNFNLCNIQVFAFVIQLFHKQQSSFRIRSSSSVECIFIFSYPTFCICPLSFRFRHPTGYCTCKFPLSTFRMELLPAGQRPMEIVGSIDLTHPRSNGGRESVERLPSAVDPGDLLHSRQTRCGKTCSRPCDKSRRSTRCCSTC